MYLEIAKELLEKEYRQRRAENKTGYLIEIMDEKILHPYQVLGAGKYLLKHEPYFAKCSDEEKDFLQAVVLLHDVARFYEFLVLGHGEKIDHGVYGAEMLAKIPEFNKMEALLPVRHHGHLIEALYADKDYQNLPLKKQKKIERIAFLVRDADKLANFYLIVTKFKEMSSLFFSERSFKTPHKKDVNAEVWDDFNHYNTVRKKYITNFAEQALGFFSWIFDLNYDFSFIFINKLHLVEKLSTEFSIYWKPKDKKYAVKQVQEFVEKKMA